MTAGWNETCPAGDPGCDAPDDGEWHCHDACEAPAEEETTTKKGLTKYPVDVSLADTFRVYVNAHSPEQAEEAARRIVGGLNDEGRARLPRGSAPVVVSVVHEPIDDDTPDAATFAWWCVIGGED